MSFSLGLADLPAYPSSVSESHVCAHCGDLYDWMGSGVWDQWGKLRFYVCGQSCAIIATEWLAKDDDLRNDRAGAVEAAKEKS